MIESDGEVSQFDSLDTFSDGGMSTENFNTMKKVRLAPIDPPPEFQVSLFELHRQFDDTNPCFAFKIFRIHHKRHYFDRQPFKVFHCN